MKKSIRRISPLIIYTIYATPVPYAQKRKWSPKHATSRVYPIMLLSNKYPIMTWTVNSDPKVGDSSVYNELTLDTKIDKVKRTVTSQDTHCERLVEPIPKCLCYKHFDFFVNNITYTLRLPIIFSSAIAIMFSLVS